MTKGITVIIISSKWWQNLKSTIFFDDIVLKVTFQNIGKKWKASSLNKKVSMQNLYLFIYVSVSSSTYSSV